jgi:hypothetical protein
MDILCHRPETPDESATQLLYSKFSQQMRTNPKRITANLRFDIHPSNADYLQLDADKVALTDNGSSSWRTVRFNCNMEWGERYYMEILVEETHYCKFIMLGIASETEYQSLLQNCLGVRFYGSTYGPQIVPGTRLGFVFDFVQDSGSLYSLINGVPMGSSATYHKRSYKDKTFFPVLCLACGTNRFRIVNDAVTPRKWKP